MSKILFAWWRGRHVELLSTDEEGAEVKPRPDAGKLSGGGQGSGATDAQGASIDLFSIPRMIGGLKKRSCSLRGECGRKFVGTRTYVTISYAVL